MNNEWNMKRPDFQNCWSTFQTLQNKLLLFFYYCLLYAVCYILRFSFDLWRNLHRIFSTFYTTKILLQTFNQSCTGDVHHGLNEYIKNTLSNSWIVTTFFICDVDSFLRSTEVILILYITLHYLLLNYTYQTNYFYKKKKLCELWLFVTKIIARSSSSSSASIFLDFYCDRYEKIPILKWGQKRFQINYCS